MYINLFSTIKMSEGTIIATTSFEGLGDLPINGDFIKPGESMHRVVGNAKHLANISLTSMEGDCESLSNCDLNKLISFILQRFKSFTNEKYNSYHLSDFLNSISILVNSLTEGELSLAEIEKKINNEFPILVSKIWGDYRIKGGNSLLDQAEFIVELTEILNSSHKDANPFIVVIKATLIEIINSYIYEQLLNSICRSDLKLSVLEKLLNWARKNNYTEKKQRIIQEMRTVAGLPTSE